MAARAAWTCTEVILARGRTARGRARRTLARHRAGRCGACRTLAQRRAGRCGACPACTNPCRASPAPMRRPLHSAAACPAGACSAGQRYGWGAVRDMPGGAVGSGRAAARQAVPAPLFRLGAAGRSAGRAAVPQVRCCLPWRDFNGWRIPRRWNSDAACTASACSTGQRYGWDAVRDHARVVRLDPGARRRGSAAQAACLTPSGGGCGAASAGVRGRPGCRSGWWTGSCGPAASAGRAGRRRG